MAYKIYNILGKAYVDTLTKTTGKPLSRLSEELGYSPTFLKNIGISGRLRTGIADLIEAKYGISVAPYIVPDEYIVRKDDPEPKRISIDYEDLAVRVAQAVIETVENYMREVNA